MRTLMAWRFSGNHVSEEEKNLLKKSLFIESTLGIAAMIKNKKGGLSKKGNAKFEKQLWKAIWSWK